MHTNDVVKLVLRLSRTAPRRAGGCLHGAVPAGRLKLLAPVVVLAAISVTFALGRSTAIGDSASASGVSTRTLYSPALQRRERVLVFVPPGYAPATQRYPLLLLLHGVPGSPEDFVRLGAFDHAAALMRSGKIPPMVIAAPVGGDHPADDNEWADSSLAPSERWETFVAHDVVRFLERRYSLVGGRGGRAVAGISMGGFGAANLALHHRNEFAAFSSWSGYFSSNTPTVHRPGSTAWRLDSPQRYVPAMRPPLARRAPLIDFYVGSRDRFAAENRAFDRLLTKLGVAHTFNLVAGATHSSTLWRAQLDSELKRIGSVFETEIGGGTPA